MKTATATLQSVKKEFNNYKQKFNDVTFDELKRENINLKSEIELLRSN